MKSFEAGGNYKKIWRVQAGNERKATKECRVSSEVGNRPFTPLFYYRSNFLCICLLQVDRE